MITGYNTDVSHGGSVLHVQTEDKGLDTAWIESLVYVGGRILARKRSSYKELLDRGEGKSAIFELMDRQHRLVIAEIRKGRFDAQLAELTGGAPPAPAVAQTAAEQVAEAVARSRPPSVPAEPVAADGGPSLDQVILDYLNTEAEQEQLVLMMDAEGELVLGRTARLVVTAKSSLSSQPVRGAEIAVRMISTVDEPATLAAGKTDPAGMLRLSVAIPPLPQGTAALILSATSSIGAAEIKHLL